MTPDSPLNLPVRVDVQTLDPVELFVAAGILAAAPDIASETIAELRGHDFTSPVLETIVRASDRVLRTGARPSPAAITDAAVTHDLIREGQRVEFERLAHDLLAAGMGEPGCWQRYALILRSALRALDDISSRAGQVRDLFPEPEGVSAAGRALQVSDEIADALEALAGQLGAEATRLRGPSAQGRLQVAPTLRRPLTLIQNGAAA